MSTFSKAQVIDQGSLAKFAAWAECYKVYLLPNGHDVIAIRSDRDEQAMFGSQHCRGAQLVWARGQTIAFDWDSFAIQTYRVRTQTEADARAIARQAHIDPAKIVDIRVVSATGKSTVEAAGSDEMQAGASAQKRLPADAREVEAPQVILAAQSGVAEIQAESEDEARQKWKFLSGAGLVKLTAEETQQRRQAGVPTGASLDKFECTAAPQKGFIGLGKKPGVWKVRWSLPCKVQFSFTLPPEFEIRYKA